MDMLHFIKTTINPEIAAQMASSVAWRIDTLLQGQARQLLKELMPTLREQGVEEFNELEASIASAVMGEYQTTQAGRDNHGPVGNIQALNMMRQNAHDLAKELVGMTFDKDGCGKHYEIPDLEEVFFAPVDLKVKPVSARRAIKSAERSAAAYGLTPEQTAVKVANTLKRKEDKAKDTSRFLMDQQPTVATLYRLASRADMPFTISEEFDELSKSIQLTLMTTARDAALRYAEWAQDYFWLTENEYEDIDSCATATATKLAAHINRLQKAVDHA